MSWFLSGVLLLWLLGLLQMVLNGVHLPLLLPDATVDGPSAPAVSVVVPARNEEAAIEEGLGSLARQSYPRLEVICVDDGSEDDTGRLARKVAEGHGRLRVIEGEGLREGWLGKPNAMRQGYEAATGEIILFSDADIVHHERSVEAGVATMQARNLDLLSALPRLRAGGVLEDLVFGVALAFLGCVPLWVVNMSFLRRNGVAAGAYIMIRREALEAIGGLDGIRRAFIDDIALGRKVKKAGYATLLARGTQTLSVRPFSDGATMIEGTEKNVFVIFRNSVLLAFVFMVLPVFGLVLLPTLLWFHFLWVFATTGGGGTNLALASAIMVIQLLLRAIPILGQEGFRWWLLPTAPLGATIWILLVLKAAFKTKVLGRTRWRGRDYAPGDPMGQDCSD